MIVLLIGITILEYKISDIGIDGWLSKEGDGCRKTRRHNKDNDFIDGENLQDFI